MDDAVDFLPGLFLALLGLAAAAYLLLPLLIKAVTVQNAAAVPVAFDPEEQPPPAAVAAHFERVTEQLAPHGFEPEAHLVLVGLVPNVSVMFRVLGRRESETAAIALFAFAKQNTGLGGVTETQRSIAFANDFEGGEVRSAETTNSPDAVTFPRSSNYSRLLCAWLRDADDLYRVHREHVRHIVSAAATGTPRPLPEPEDWAATLADDLHAENEGYRRLGYFRAVRNGRRAMTLKGAYLATWKQLPPVKQFLAAKRTAAAKARLRAWGLDDLK